MADSDQLIYVAPHSVSREEAEAVLKKGTRSDLCNTMAGVAFYEQDRVWAQDFFVRCAAHSDSGVRSLSATCFGHLARIHGVIDEDIVLPVLVRLYQEAGKVRGYVENAISDINMFLDWSKAQRKAFYRAANGAANGRQA